MVPQRTNVDHSEEIAPPGLFGDLFTLAVNNCRNIEQQRQDGFVDAQQSGEFVQPSGQNEEQVVERSHETASSQRRKNGRKGKTQFPTVERIVVQDDSRQALVPPEDAEYYSKKELVLYLQSVAPQEVLLRYGLLGKPRGKSMKALKNALQETWDSNLMKLGEKSILVRERPAVPHPQHHRGPINKLAMPWPPGEIKRTTMPTQESLSLVSPRGLSLTITAILDDSTAKRACSCSISNCSSLKGCCSHERHGLKSLAHDMQAANASITEGIVDLRSIDTLMTDSCEPPRIDIHDQSEDVRSPSKGSNTSSDACDSLPGVDHFGTRALGTVAGTRLEGNAPGRLVHCHDQDQESSPHASSEEFLSSRIGDLQDEHITVLELSKRPSDDLNELNDDGERRRGFSVFENMTPPASTVPDQDTASYPLCIDVEPQRDEEWAGTWFGSALGVLTPWFPSTGDGSMRRYCSEFVPNNWWGRKGPSGHIPSFPAEVDSE